MDKGADGEGYKKVLVGRERGTEGEKHDEDRMKGRGWEKRKKRKDEEQREGGL